MSPSTHAGDLASLSFTNRFTANLPADPVEDNRVRQVHAAAYSRVRPTPVAQPTLLAHAREVSGGLLGLAEETVAAPEFAQVFGGNRLLEGMDPFAMCYGGHQFGHWAGQLGDGRAINLGEVQVPDGSHWTLQLKGAGRTPYSRTADGLAVLRSSVREFLCSEAMHHLGVPTTRALSLVTTGEEVMRDMFYDGNARLEPGAIVCRVARSFTRFGNFQLPASRGELELLRQLVDHTIRSDFPELGAPASGELGKEHYVEWYREVCRRTSDMIIHWMRVGFVHGVMNTDNMSILGETIDYGPYGWLEDYDLGWTPNTTDASHHRYCFGRQAPIAHWNLAQLGSALVPLLDGDKDPLVEILEAYPPQYSNDWRSMMLAKLGLQATTEAEDQALLDDLQEVLQLAETDMTLFFRRLVDLPAEGDAEALRLPLQDAFYEDPDPSPEAGPRLDAWLQRYAGRVRGEGRDPEQRRRDMNAVNPIYVLRNYLAQTVIDACAEGDASRLHALHDALRHPYEEKPGLEEFAAKRPEWARHRPGCSMLSCSS